MEVTNPYELICQKLDKLSGQVSDLKSRLENIETSKPAKDQMTVAELADYLSLAKQTIYNLASGRRIPFSKRFGRLYFDKSSIDDWVNSCSEEQRDWSLEKDL